MKRSFRVWKDPSRRYRNVWRWECSFCQLPARGCRTTSDAWPLILSISFPRHMEHRRCHHAYVARAHG